MGCSRSISIVKNDILYKKALMGKKCEKYEYMIKKFKKAIVNGHLKSVYQMGLYHEEINEYPIAQKYYQLAIRNGHVISLYRLELVEKKIELQEKEEEEEEEWNSEYN